MTYYSALHYAAKAEKSANLAEQYATQATQFSGRIIQLGFDGTLEDGVLTFKHAPSGIEVPYDLLDDYEYEIDMVYQGSDLADDVELVVKNGADTINFVSALHRDSTTPVTVKDMKSVMRYDESTGYRWLFKAAFKVTPLGDKVLLLYPVISIGGSGTGRNIGDIFYTSRLDDELNGAVEADGTIYSVEAFTGEQSVPALLAEGKLPYVSMAEYESIVSANGSCRAWGWDNGDTFRVPTLKDVYLMAGQAESAGEFISESLPNITGTVTDNRVGDVTNTISPSTSFNEGQNQGALRNTYIGGNASAVSLTSNSSYTWVSGIEIDASRSSSTYQDGAKVHPDSVRYRAMVQLATGVKEDATQLKEYKFNNPHFFGESKWTDVEPNNASWLLSNGAFHSGATYSDYYEWLLEQRNANLKTVYLWKSTIDEQIMFTTETDTLSVGNVLYGYIPNIKSGEIIGISGNDVTIKNDVTNQIYTQSIDVANPISSIVYLYDRSKINVISKTELDYWTYPNNTSDYDFVINTDDQTFRLPLLNGEEDLPSDRKISLTIGATGSSEIAPANGFYCLHASNNTNSLEIYVGTSTNFTFHTTTHDTSGWNGVFVNVSKGDRIEYYYSGTGTPDVFQFIYAKGNGTLYYYVGDVLQDASLINAGGVLTDLATKTNSVQAAAASMPSGRYIDLTLGASGASYIAPANGWFVLWKVCNGFDSLAGLYGSVQSIFSGDANEEFAIYIPVKKGEVIYCYYTNLKINQVHDRFTFFYAEGEG